MYFCNHVKTTNTISKMRRKFFLLLLLVTGMQAIAQVGSNTRETKNNYITRVAHTQLTN